MAGETKSLQFSEGVSVSAPTQTFISAGELITYASDAAYVSAKGSAAEEGDIYGNTTDNKIHYYNGSTWKVNEDNTNNFTATADPTVNDDSGDGYTVGSTWINTSTDSIFVCADNSSGAAVWVLSGGDVATGDANTLHLIWAKSIELSDIDLTGQNASFDGGGTITASSLSLSTTAAEQLLSTTVIKYDPNANGQNDYFGFTKAIPVGARGQHLNVHFNYKNDSTTVNAGFRFCFKIKDGASAGTIVYYNMPAVNNSDNNGDIFRESCYVPTDCTEVEFGWQNTDTITTVELYIDNILIEQRPYEQVVYLKDVKGDAVEGGSFSSGSWLTRTLNTEEKPCDYSFLSLSSSQFTLSPGIYDIYGGAPAFQVSTHQVRLRNISDDTTDILGAQVNAPTSDSTHNHSTLHGYVSITSSKTFELQHRCTTTKTANGFGLSAGLGESSIYATVRIKKIK